MLLFIEWSLLLVATGLLLWPKLDRLSSVLLLVSYSLAYFLGQLDGWFLVSVGLLLCSAMLLRISEERVDRVIAHGLFIGWVLCAMLHVLPGFHNLALSSAVRLTSDAIPFRVYLNLDTLLVAFWIVYSWPYLQRNTDQREWVRYGLIFGGLSIAVCLSLALSLNVVTWAPKWPMRTLLWMAHNLLLVCLVEELLFRGYIQEGLSRLLAPRYPAYAAWAAILITAVLFGLRHYTGGLEWIFLTGVAGIGYGLAYHYGKLQAALLSHFGLNVCHFLLFTYPRLIPG